MFKQINAFRWGTLSFGAFLLAIAVMFGGSDRVEAATLTISDTDVRVGDLFDITINLERLETIGAIRAQLLSDPAKVEAISRGPGSVFAGLVPNIDFTLSESVEPASYFFLLAFAADRTGPIDLLNVTFKALVEGNTTISFQGSGALFGSNDPFPIELNELSFDIGAADTGGGDLTPVPLPASGLLLAAALAAFLVHGRRRVS